MRYLLITVIACFCLAGCVRDPYYYDDGPSVNVNRNVNRDVNRNVTRHHSAHHRPAPHHHHHHGHR